MNVVMEARALLEDVTPLNQDCGTLCHGACCQADESGANGMLLYPGEEQAYQDVAWAHLVWDQHMSSWRLTCKGECPRAQRPMGCRIFPLVPYWNGTKFIVKMDVRGWPVCPLMSSGKKGLRQDFVSAARKSVKLLGADPAQAAFMVRQTEQVQAFENLTL